MSSSTAESAGGVASQGSATSADSAVPQGGADTAVTSGDRRAVEPDDVRQAVPDHPGRVPALDGIRAVAVAAVLLYHADIGWAQGGFLGVDVFFVLSGYLITGLLAGEFLRTGRISLRRFYLRRARRLLPALFTVIAAVCVAVVVWLPNDAATVRGDATASLGYVTNWWFIAHQQSYFGSLLRPSMLLHLWSLAVEEQFYLIWPVLMLVMLRSRAGTDRITTLWRTVGWAVLLGGASAATMAYLYSPWVDPSRVYYGTDTRAFELLIGVTLSLVQMARAAEREAAGKPPTDMARWAGLNDAVSGSALAAVVLSFLFLRTNSSVVYPWGLVGVCVVAAVLIQTAVNGGAIASLLSTRPMVWLGERSYALYLWHWPIFDVTRPVVDVTWPTWLLYLVRFGGSIALAEATYRWIERPIRGGVLGRTVARSRAAWREQRFVLPASVGTSALACVVAAVVLATRVDVTAARHPSTIEGFFTGAGRGENPPASASPAPGPTPTASAASGNTGGAPATGAPSPSRPATTTPALPMAVLPANFPPRPADFPAPPAKRLKVQFVGDSQGLTLVWSWTADFANYLDVTNAATMGCGLFLGVISSYSGGVADQGSACKDAIADWVKTVNLVHPDVAIMTVGAWEVYNVQVNGKYLVFGTPAWDDYYRTRLALAVSQLETTGVPKIDLSLQPCWHPIAAMMPGISAERGTQSRTDHLNELMKAFAATAGPRVGLLTPPPQFCTDPSIGNNTKYRADGVHYMQPGAVLYYQTIIPQLFARKQ